MFTEMQLSNTDKKALLKRFISFIEDERCVNNLTPVLEAATHIDEFIEYDKAD